MPIPHSCPTINKNEEDAVKKVLRNGYLAQGKEVALFEEEIAKLTNTLYAAAASSGTAALTLLLLAMGVREGDEVMLPSFACASFLCAVRAGGGVPKLVDVPLEGCNIDPVSVSLAVTKKTKAIIAIHQFGIPAPIKDLKSYALPVIEAGAQALGGADAVNNKPIGSLGDAAFFSFYATKVITTGEGGMVVSNNKRWINKIKEMREYDKKNDCSRCFNYKMTDLAASIGRVQLGKLALFLEKREKLAKAYSALLKDTSTNTANTTPLDGTITLPSDIPGRVWFRYVIMCKSSQQRNLFLKELNKNGIESKVSLFKPLHRYLNLPDKEFPGTMRAWARSISLPIYPSLKIKDVQKIAVILKSLLLASSC